MYATRNVTNKLRQLSFKLLFPFGKLEQLFQCRKLDVAEIDFSLPNCFLPRARGGTRNSPLLHISCLKLRRVSFVRMLCDIALDVFH